MKSTIRARPSSRWPSRNAPLSRLAFLPRSRNFAPRRSHRNHEQEISCRGDQRRAIICAIEKFMNKLQVLVDSGRWPPDFRGQLMPPVVMAGDALAIAGQVESGAALPVG